MPSVLATRRESKEVINEEDVDDEAEGFLMMSNPLEPEGRIHTGVASQTATRPDRPVDSSSESYTSDVENDTAENERKDA
jgi:hypothetical protein